MADKAEAQLPKDSRIVEDPYGVVSRRGFISWLTVGWGAFIATLGVMGGAFQRFLFPNVLREPPQQFKGMFPSDLADGVDETYKDAYGVWLVKGVDPVSGKRGVCALSTICTHLGCTPTWLATEEKFKCPCHGSGFKSTGLHFEGPAPRPLERYKISLAEDGHLQVDKTRKFQFEKGQWSDPESFLLS